MGQRRGIAVALDLELVGRHGQRNVDGQHQFDIDGLGSGRIARPAKPSASGNGRNGQTSSHGRKRT